MSSTSPAASFAAIRVHPQPRASADDREDRGDSAEVGTPETNLRCVRCERRWYSSSPASWSGHPCFEERCDGVLVEVER